MGLADTTQDIQKTCAHLEQQLEGQVEQSRASKMSLTTCIQVTESHLGSDTSLIQFGSSYVLMFV